MTVSALGGAKHALRPTTLVERRRQTKKQAQFAWDVVVSVCYLFVTHIILPLFLASTLMSYQWTRLGLLTAIPAAFMVALAYAQQQKREPIRVSWEFPNAIQIPGGQWQFTQRDLTLNFRRWHHHIIWLRTFLAAVLIGWLCATTRAGLAGLLCLFWLVWFVRKLGGRQVRVEPPYKGARLRQAMADTRLWKAGDLPAFQHIRPHKQDDCSDTIWVSLHGKPYTEFIKKKDEFVASLGLSHKKVRISNEGLNLDEACIRFSNGKPVAAKKHWALEAAHLAVEET